MDTVLMDIVELFAARRSERLRKAWQAYQSSNPIASDLHDCDRYQVMRLVAWKVRETPDDRGLEVMEDGNVLEQAMVRQLQDEGWEIVEQQAPFEVRQPLEPGGTRRRILSGRMDGKVRLPGSSLLPIEFKSTSEWNLDTIEDEADLREKSVWTRKWWRQLQIYMLGAGYEQALLVLGFRGRRRVIRVELDLDEAERILQVASRAVGLFGRAQDEGIDETTVDAWLNGVEGAPDYHTVRETCRRCPFWNRACFPPDAGEETAQARPDLEDVVARYLETKAAVADHERARKILKSETEGFEQTVAGQHVIDGALVTRNLKPRPATPAKMQQYWSFKVRGVDDDE